MEQKASYDIKICELEEEVEQLKTQVKSGNERSMKLRAGYEREKRILETQIDKLTKSLETKDAEAALEAKKVASKHQTELKALQQQIEELIQGREEDRRAYERARDALVQNTDEWCQGEIDAVRRQADNQLQKAKAETQVWMDRVGKAMEASDDLKKNLDQERKRSEALKGDLDRGLEELQSAEATARALAIGFESERSEWQAKLDSLNAKRIEELSDLKASHRSQLEVVDSRLQQVVAKKDAAILTLRRELSDVSGRLRKFESLVGEGHQDQVEERISHSFDPRLRKSTGGGLLPISRQNQSILDSRGLSARH